MSFLREVLEWFTDPANWAGVSGIPNRAFEHIEISVLSLVLASLIAVPAGLYIGRTRRFEFLVVSVANFGRAIPSFAILALALPLTIRLGLGLGFWPTVIALFLLAIPPILTNTYVGVQEIDPDVIEAAAGTGMSGRDLLIKVELPLATPLIVVGLRTAFVQVIATATLAALVAWGGLGRFIVDGFSVRDQPQIFGGALLVAFLAIAVEFVFGLIERIVRPASDEPRLRVNLGG